MSNGNDNTVDYFLDWLQQRSDASPGTYVECDDYLISQLGYDLPRALEFVRECARLGLVHEANGLGSSSARISEVGRHRLAAFRTNRSDRAQRMRTAHSNLLRWIFEQEHAGIYMPTVNDVMASPLGRHLGDPLTPDEVARAAEYLEQKGLIAGPSVAELRGPLRAELTPYGNECMLDAGGDVQ